MTKDVIKAKLETSFGGLIKNVEPIDDKLFFAPIGEKWSPAQNVLHLTLSAKALNQGLGLPKAFLEQQFGRIERDSVSYAEIVDKYLTTLQATNIRGGGGFITEMPENASKTVLMESFQKHHQQLADFLDSWSETDLDNYGIKHPLLGLLTVREFFYFMDYHTLHHEKAILKA